MLNHKQVFVGLTIFAVSACGGATPQSETETESTVSNVASAAPAAAPANEDPNHVATVQRTGKDGRTIETRELVGPDVQPQGTRPMRMDEIREIEAATGRAYREGDSVHGRARTSREPRRQSQDDIDSAENVRINREVRQSQDDYDAAENLRLNGGPE